MKFRVRVVPVRVGWLGWRRLWELHVEGVAVTQSRRRHKVAERTARDYVRQVTGEPREEVGIVLVPGCPALREGRNW